MPGAPVVLCVAFEDRRERVVDGSSLRDRSRLVDRGAHERVPQLQATAANLDEAGALGRIERGGLDAEQL